MWKPRWLCAAVILATAPAASAGQGFKVGTNSDHVAGCNVDAGYASFEPAGDYVHLSDQFTDPYAIDADVWVGGDFAETLHHHEGAPQTLQFNRNYSRARRSTLPSTPRATASSAAVPETSATHDNAASSDRAHIGDTASDRYGVQVSIEPAEPPYAVPGGQAPPPVTYPRPCRSGSLLA